MQQKSPRHDSSAKEPNKALIYSASKDSLADYAETFERIGISHDTASNLPDAKKMLLTGEFDTLHADVTDFESSGHRLIHWAQNHIPEVVANFKTHGYTRTDVPSIHKTIYSIGSDQRFYYDHVDYDQLTEVMASLFINRKDISWINEMRDGQRRLRKNIGNGSPTLNPVLLRGAKGLGKECLAQIVHCMCDRRPNNFVVLDCNPRQRFDYAQSTTVDNRTNREIIRRNLELMLGEGFGGTVFFRSFTHLSIMAQSVLVDVLKKGVCRMPKTGETVKYEGRIVFSSNKILADLVQAKQLDERLFAMLSKNMLEVKSLVLFKDDLLPMAEAITDFLCIKSRGKTMKFVDSAKRLIRSYPWSGNIIQMFEVMRMAVTTATGLKIRERDLSIKRIEPFDEKAEIERLLEVHNNIIAKVADDLGRSRPYLYKKMKEYGIANYAAEEKMDA